MVHLISIVKRSIPPISLIIPVAKKVKHRFKWTLEHHCYYRSASCSPMLWHILSLCHNISLKKRENFVNMLMDTDTVNGLVMITICEDLKF